MKKYISLFLIFCLLLCGCGNTAAAPSETACTFTDDLGRQVTVDSPKRVAALLGSFAQVWQLAGGQVIATADDAWDDLQLELAEDTVNLGNTKNLSLELLLGARPDFILASTNTRQNMQWQETLEGTGVPVAYFDVANFDDYLHLLDICTDITGRKDLYETYGLAVQSQIDAVLERSAQRGTNPTVLSLRASASTATVKNSRDNVLGEMLASLGCVNIADSDDFLLENLSLEHILVSDPEFIFIVQRGDDAAGMREYVEQNLMSHPLWSQLTAVQEGKVYFMDKTLFNLKPNHRWGEAYEILEEILENG